MHEVSRPEPSPDEPRPRTERRDAAENRERLLIAAERFFAERGVDAPLHELAARAGVGIGTLYRRFPSHPDLIRGLYDRISARVDLLIEGLGSRESGWEAVSDFIDGSTRIVFDSPALIPVMQRMLEHDPDYRPGDRWIEPLAGFIRRAQEEGSLRPDVTGYDIATLPFTLGTLSRLPEPARSAIYSRQYAIVMDGLRRQAQRTPLPEHGLDASGYHRAIHRGRPDPVAADGD